MRPRHLVVALAVLGLGFSAFAKAQNEPSKASVASPAHIMLGPGAISYGENVCGIFSYLVETHGEAVTGEIYKVHIYSSVAVPHRSRFFERWVFSSHNSACKFVVGIAPCSAGYRTELAVLTPPLHQDYGTSRSTPSRRRRPATAF